MLDRFVRFFTSLRLTVVLLALGLVLVFWGTLAQVNLGLYRAQNEFFRSFLIHWQPAGSNLRIPIFPGGYLVGGLLLINLIAAHARYYRPRAKKIGIVFIHAGLVLLLLGQFATDLLSVESTMHLREGETRNYSEVDRRVELAVTDVTDPQVDRVVSVPQRVLERQGEIRNDALPFAVRVQRYFFNASLANRPPNATEPPPATQGIGQQAVVTEQPHVTEMGKRDVPAAIVEIIAPTSSLGTWLVSEYINQPQRLTHDGRAFTLEMRQQRDYKPYSLKLLDFRHDKYPGTEIPKNFSSRVLLNDPRSGEEREILIYMNNPLRYGGETYYQSSYDPDDQGSILQVVRNPSWLTPYLACVLVSVGLTVQFLIHLVQFVGKRRTV